MSVYAFRSGPTYRAATPAEQFDAAFDQPMSLSATLGQQFKGGILESLGLGTALRSLSLPERITDRPARGESLEQRKTRIDAYNESAMPEDAFKASPYYRDGVKWDRGMTEDRAAALAEAYDAKRVRDHFASKRPFTAFLGNLAGQAFDPINYIPIAGPTVKAASIARLGRVGGHIATGALDAAANTAIASAATYDTRQSMGDEITWQSTVTDIAMSALIGSAFGTIGGVIDARRSVRLADAKRAAEAQLATLKNVQEARIALNGAIDGLARGEDVVLSANAADAVQRIQGKALESVPEQPQLMALPSSSSLNTPPVPTPEQMSGLSRVESVPLDMARGTQSRMEWDRFTSQQNAPPALIRGYEDMPVAVRREDGEYLIFDGHHRTVQALREGKKSLDMHVVNAKDYAPEAAGRKPVKQDMSDDELLRQLMGDSEPAGRDVAAPSYELRSVAIGEEAIPSDQVARVVSATGPIGKKPARPRSLLDFLAGEGGIKDDAGDLAAIGVTRKFVPGRGSLIRKSGMELDKAREAAAQAGYFDHIYGTADEAAEKSTVRDLLDLIDQESRGTPAYSMQEQARVEAIQDYEAAVANRAEYKKFVSDLAKTLNEMEIGVAVDDAVLARATDIMVQEDLPPLDAFDKAVLEDQARFEASLSERGISYRDREKLADIPFFDEPAGPDATARGVAGRAEQDGGAGRRARDEADRRQFAGSGADAVKGIDLSTPRPELPPQGRAEAESRIAKPDDYKAISEQYRVNADDGSFIEEADIDQVRTEGRLTADDEAALAEAQQTFDNGVAYGEALKSVAGCFI